MQKELPQPQKEMTITEVGGLVLKLVDTTTQMSSRIDKMGNEIKAVEDRLSHKIESVEIKLTEKIAQSEVRMLQKIDESEEFLARTVNKGFIMQDKEIQGLQQEMNENIGKVQNDIWNLDERFVTRREFTLGLK